MCRVTETSAPRPAIDFSTFDPDVRVQDDLFRHVNGTWLNTTEIPADKPLTGAFMELRDQAEAAVRDIITDPRERGAGLGRGQDRRPVRQLHGRGRGRGGRCEPAPAAARRDRFCRDSAGTDAAARRLRPSGGARAGGAGDRVRPGDPNRYVMFAGQGGFGLPDEEYYRRRRVRRDPRAVSRSRRDILRAGRHRRTPRAQAQQVFDLETEIAATHWDKVKMPRPAADVQPDEPGRVRGRAVLVCTGGSSWPEVTSPSRTMGELVAMQPSFFAEVSALLTEDRLPAWRAWATWRVINSLSPYLSSAFVEENFRFYGTVLSGTPELRERWKRGCRAGRGLARRGGRQDLRRPALLPGRQGADGSAGGQPDRGVPALHHRS